jgi:SAM-dependent methyltransferase
MLWDVFRELEFRAGAEIGVAKGKNARNIVKQNPDAIVHLIDPWEKYRENPRGWDADIQDIHYNHVKDQFKDNDKVFIHRDISMNAVRDFSYGELDFVYIDGHHGFDYVMQDLIEWSKVVRPGGIVSGHDYYRFRWAGVVPAVDAYTHAHQIHEWFITDEKETTFFWARPEITKSG